MSPMDPILNALGNVQSGDLATRLRGSLAIEAEKQLLAEFRQSRDPYGRAWAPVARGGKPLDDSGNLRGSRVSVPTSDGIEVGLAAPYASYQQFGTRARKRRVASFARARAAARAAGRKLGPGGIRPREMLPISAGLGQIWGDAFERRTAAVMREVLR